MNLHLMTFGASLAAAVTATAQPLVIAHRGESVDAPENTMPSYRLAMERDTDGFECDIYLTKDGEIVCSHDDDLKRCGKSPLKIKDATVAELRKVDLGVWKGEAFKGTRIPLFREMISLARDGHEIFVEVKCGPEILPKLRDELAKQPGATPNRVVFISFNAKVIAALRKELPGYRAYLLISFCKDKKTGLFKPTPAEVLAKAKACNTTGVDVSPYDIPNSYITDLIKAGLHVQVCIIDKDARARELAKLGVESITSNRAAAIKKALQE